MEYKIKTEGETSFQAFRPLFKLKLTFSGYA